MNQKIEQIVFEQLTVSHTLLSSNFYSKHVSSEVFLEKQKPAKNG